MDQLVALAVRHDAAPARDIGEAAAGAHRDVVDILHARGDIHAAHDLVDVL
ncbi:hypothetical protein [Nocardia alni]|uniref:hypothetical protein n=1 Tax=Nocardia alni TaxID=2815723 RepID=UPI001C22EEAF|nr:hypothetical protein [Nocardia alni]